MNNVAFRRLRVHHQPIKTEMVRCHEKFAIMDAGDGISGYVLERQRPRGQRDLFYIYTKFSHTMELPPENLPPLVDQPQQEGHPTAQDPQTATPAGRTL
mgnify:CR=1 FL=1